MTYALLLSVLLAPTTTVEFRLLPPGHDGLVEGVGRARYYLLDEYLQLAEFDSELYVLRKNYDSILKAEKSLRVGLDARATETNVCLKELGILTTRSSRLLENWRTCEEALQKSNGGIAAHIKGFMAGAIITLAGAGLIQLVL